MPPADPAPPDSDQGRSVAGSGAGQPVIPDFELIRRIGQGSYGDVWLARGLTGQHRAIKIVWRDRFPTAEPFEREFKGLKKFTSMHHPESGQLALLHVGQNEAAGFFYYVMELADDVETGDEISPAKYVPLTLREVRQRRGRLPAADCVNYGVELARALAGLHSRGLVHRDIKPSNVILVGGVPKLADIGLVASTGDALTYVGTEGFVPPEGPGKPSADVFALGRLLYELATGLDREEFPRLPAEMNKLPDRKLLFELNEIILRACEAESGRRYPDASAILADLLALQAGSPVRRRRSWVGLAAAAALIVVVAVVGFWWKSRSVPPTVAAAASTAVVSDKSVAVLPFVNLSEEKDASAFFSDGVHEDILTSLGLILELRVVSRTSVMQYRATTKMIKQIGQELGVAYLVEGSVRRLANKVRVTAQLIDARSDAHLWTQTYDRDLTDIFAIQSEIAQAIAAALQAKLSPGEASLLARRPTSNPAAYDLYLQARALKNATVFSHRDYEALLKRAIDLDPKFAAAWAALGSDYAFQYFDDRDHTAGQLAAAKEAIETAAQLAPDDPEVVEGLGDYYYYGYRDYARATEQYLRLLHLRPNDAAMHFSLGLIHRRQGRWDDSLAEIRQARQLDPRNRRFALALVRTLICVNRYEEAEKLARQIVAEYPRDVVAAAYLGTVTFRARGSTAEWKELVSRAIDPAQAEELAVALRDAAAESGDWTGYLRMVRDQRYVALGGPHWTQDVDAAMVLADTGDPAAARALVDAVLPQMETELAHQPESVILWACVAVAHALKGEKDEALRCANRLVELRPEGRDALDTPQAALFRASIWARTGETERALTELARLLRVPNGANVHYVRSGLFEGATFQPLRGNPRFEAMMADPANNAPMGGNGSAGVAPLAPAPSPDNSVAVLSFVNLSDDKENEYFSDGISEELLTVLQKIPGLHVAARTSSFSFKGRSATAQEIGEKLGVAHLVEGSVRKAGNMVRISARLSRVHTGEQLWSESYTREHKDVFTVQSEIARTIVEQLRGRLGGGPTGAEARNAIQAEVQAAEKGGTRNVEAHEFYLQGRFYASQFSLDNFARAVGCFRGAIKADPSYALAWAALARVLPEQLAMADVLPQSPVELVRESREAADRALALEPTLADGYAAQFKLHILYDLDWKGAAASAREAFRLAPLDATNLVHLGRIALIFGDSTRAIDLSRQAVALDPLNSEMRFLLADALGAAGRFKDAENECRRGLELNPEAGFLNCFASLAVLHQGRFEEAAVFAGREKVDWLRRYALAQVWWAKGKIPEANAELEQLVANDANIAAYQIAQVFGYRQDSDQAFAWLERAFRQHDAGLGWLRLDPFFKSLHDDPRWPAFLRRVGLADDQLTPLA